MKDQCFHCGRPLDSGFNCPAGHSQQIVYRDEEKPHARPAKKPGQFGDNTL